MSVLLAVRAPAPANASLAPVQEDSADPEVLYLLPILDGQPTTERVQVILDRLGRGGPFLQVGFSGVFRYMADVDPHSDYQIVTTRLEEIAAAARETRSPFLIHLNGGRWAGGGPLIEMLAADPDAMAWDHLDRPWRHLVDGEFHFSLSIYNERWRSYKERNLKAAAAWLADFANGPDGDLLVGVSTDSEVLLGLQPYFDYNPAVQWEFVNWLSSDGPYGPGGRWEADGQGLSRREMNERYGTSFPRWKDVQPPRQNDDGPFWRDWTTFRVLLVDHSVQEQVDWIGEAGLPAEKIFSHQGPGLNPDVFGDSLITAHVAGGGLGITLYGEQSVNPDLLDAARSLSSRWGVFEYNPQPLYAQGASYEANLAALDLLRSHAPQIICPYHWDDLGGKNEIGYTILGTPLEAALQTFVQMYAADPLPVRRGDEQPS